MNLSFNYLTSPAKIMFGPDGISKIAVAAGELGCERLLVLSTEQQKSTATNIAESLGGLCAGIHAQAVMHTPVNVTEEAIKVVAGLRVDGLLSIGGGSTIGLGKAIALRTDLPQIVIPTTYAGSEVTPILGQTENGVKTTLRSSKVLPEVVIYDPKMTYSLPAAMSITSGINAIAHAIEALYAQDKNPVSSMMAVEGATALIDALPLIAKDPFDAQAREKAFYGSWLCGTVLGNVGMALHHKLCHTLGGMFDLPHAQTHTVMLPHTVAYNETQVPELLAPVAKALNANSAGSGLFEFAQQLAAPTSLAELGMPEHGIDLAAEQAMANPYWNPRRLEHSEIRQLISNAYHGNAPD